MTLLNEALRAAHAPAPRPAAAARTVLVVGAGGALGSAVLEQALGGGGFRQVQALVAAPVAPALATFHPLPEAQLARRGTQADTAFVVFDRERHVNGRDEAFVRPQPEQLPGIARRLHAAGVRHLLVVLPHAPGALPQALQQGLASLDEQAVAALDFRHVLFVRSPQAPAGATARGLQRLAHWMLGQLQMMLPQQHQPVRAARLAAFAVHLARRLPDAAPGTRVVPPEVSWLASQVDEAEVARAWLAGEPLPAVAGRRPRY